MRKEEGGRREYGGSREVNGKARGREEEESGVVLDSRDKESTVDCLLLLVLGCLVVGFSGSLARLVHQNGRTA